MKVLLDEDLPHELRLHLLDFEEYTVRYLRWDGLKKGTLLRTAEEAGFDVFVTGDRNLTAQQNIHGHRIGVVTLTEQRFAVLVQYVGLIASALRMSVPGSVQVVECSGRGRSYSGSGPVA